MEIGKRLRELREANNLSQGDIEKRSGLLRSYVSRVEGGYTAPSLETLEKWVNALGLELYQLFYEGSANPKAPKLSTDQNLAPSEKKLVHLFRRLDKSDRALVSMLARGISKR